MSDTPDLDKAREAARVLHTKQGCKNCMVNYTCCDTAKPWADAFLEQRAEEAERCAEMVRSFAPFSLADVEERAADLRRQAAAIRARGANESRRNEV